MYSETSRLETRRREASLRVDAGPGGCGRGGSHPRPGESWRSVGAWVITHLKRRMRDRRCRCGTSAPGCRPVAPMSERQPLSSSGARRHGKASGCPAKLPVRRVRWK